MTVIETAEYYFKLSNERNLGSISKMFTKDSVYESETTGTYYGREDIMKMMKSFFKDFEDLHWTIDNIVEIEQGVIEINFIFEGKKLSGDKIKRLGIERLTIDERIIKRIEIKNRF